MKATTPGSPAETFGDRPRVKEFDLSFVRRWVSGGAPLAMEVLQRFEALTGHAPKEGYGLTEIAPLGTLQVLDKPARPGSVGLPAPHTVLEVVDLETGERVLPIGRSQRRLKKPSAGVDSTPAILAPSKPKGPKDDYRIRPAPRRRDGCTRCSWCQTVVRGKRKGWNSYSATDRIGNTTARMQASPSVRRSCRWRSAQCRPSCWCRRGPRN